MVPEPSIEVVKVRVAVVLDVPCATADKVSARSLQIVGDVLLAALPALEERLRAGAAARP